MIKYFFPLLLIPILAQASSDGGEKDILERTVNFLIFAGILYYLVANKLKAFFVNRRDGIANQLDDIQQKLQESKNKKNDALKKVQEAKENAKILLTSFEKENKIILAKMESELNKDIENLEKLNKDQMSIERRKMTRSVVSDILNELFIADFVKIDKEKFINIITSKVA